MPANAIPPTVAPLAVTKVVFEGNNLLLHFCNPMTVIFFDVLML